LSKNINVYPDDFTSDIAASGSIDPTAAIENAVTGLEVTARDTALRLVNQRRLAAQSIISTQNNQVRAFHKRMPPQVVGKGVAQSLTLGSTVFIPGTGGLQIFNLLNEVFRRSSCVLPGEHVYGSTIGNSESGKFAGGFIDMASGLTTSSVDKILYYPRESVKGQIAKLSDDRISAIGQMGDRTRGLLAGGGTSFGVLKQDCSVYNHVSDAIALLSNFLQRTRYAPHGGLSSKFAGYILGGCEKYGAGALVNSIEKIDYASTLTSSRYVAGTTPHAHVAHAAFGNDISGYLAGGSNSFPPWKKWNTSDITEFPFATETPFLSSSRLPNELVCSFGAGSSDAGYIFSGWVDSTFSSLNNSGVFKFRYSDKQASLVESRLLEQAWDRGAISDYGAGFSYA
jgi:hypothetical protein